MQQRSSKTFQIGTQNILQVRSSKRCNGTLTKGSHERLKQINYRMLMSLFHGLEY